MSDDKDNKIVPAPGGQIQKSVDTYSKGLVQYLDTLGLPTENVLVEVKQRELPGLTLTDPLKSHWLHPSWARLRGCVP